MTPAERAGPRPAMVGGVGGWEAACLPGLVQPARGHALARAARRALRPPTRPLPPAPPLSLVSGPRTWRLPPLLATRQCRPPLGPAAVDQGVAGLRAPVRGARLPPLPLALPRFCDLPGCHRGPGPPDTLSDGASGLAPSRAAVLGPSTSVREAPSGPPPPPRPHSHPTIPPG